MMVLTLAILLMQMMAQTLVMVPARAMGLARLSLPQFLHPNTLALAAPPTPPLVINRVVPPVAPL